MHQSDCNYLPLVDSRSYLVLDLKAYLSVNPPVVAGYILMKCIIPWQYALRLNTSHNAKKTLYYRTKDFISIVNSLTWNAALSLALFSAQFTRLIPEQVIAMVDGPDQIPSHRSEDFNEPSDGSYSSLTELQMLCYKKGDTIIVLDRRHI